VSARKESKKTRSPGRVPGQPSGRALGFAAAREPWLATGARMIVHGVTAAVFSWPLTVPEAVVAAAVGSALGALSARFVAASKLRLGAILGFGVAGLFAVFFIGGLWGRTDIAAQALGPGQALRVGDALEFSLAAFVLSTTLRAVTLRRAALSAIEVAFIALAFGQLVVAHQDGAINRPFEIADPIISGGSDPTIALMIIGGVAAAVVILLLLSERNIVRGVFHLGAVALLLVFGLFVVGLMPEATVPETGGGLGLRGDDGSEEQRRQEQAGRRNNEQLEFRDNYDNAQNRVPVGVVLLHDDYSSPTGVYYLRQGAFSQYNGRRLVAATRADVDRDIARGFPTSPTPITDAPDESFFRGSIETTVALLATHNRPFALEAPVELRPEPNPNPRRFKRLYRARSAVLIADHISMLGLPVGDAMWSDEVLRHYTEAPPDPRYRELAERIIIGLPEDLRDDPVARALSVTQYLSEEGTYSLRSRHADADDPTGSFLFGDLTGYCVHFSHAATYLMRTLGIPARVATGYAVDEASRQGGSAILVSGQASHAWPEVYVDGVGWVVMDVAPQTVLSAPPGPPDPDLQRLLAELVRGQQPLPIDGEAAIDLGGAVRDALLWVGRGLGVLALVAFVFVVLGRLWRRSAALFAGDAASRVVYRAALDSLSAVGIRRDYGESREAFARRVEGLVPSFGPLTGGHVAAHFGASTDAGEVGAADPRALFRDVRRELRAAVPRRRRVLAILSPWTWLFSR